jgi:hypothetical protein
MHGGPYVWGGDVCMRGRRGRVVIGFTNTCAISAYHTKVVTSNPDTTLFDKVCQ